jgi:hypothetical protein
LPAFVYETLATFSAQESTILVVGHAQFAVFGFVAHCSKLQLEHIGFHLVDHRQFDQCSAEFLPCLALGQFLEPSLT